MNITDYEQKTRENIMSFLDDNEYCRDYYTNYEASFDEDMYVSRPASELHLFEKKNLIVLMTANDVEMGVLHVFLNNHCQEGEYGRKIIRIVDGKIVYYFSKVGRYDILHVCNKTGAYSEGGSAETIRTVMSKLNPILVISTGVAFGIDWVKQSLCDVIISERILVYDKGIKITDGKLVIKREHILSTEATLMERIRQHRSLMRPGKLPRFQIGDVLTGEAVVSDTDFKAMICGLFSSKSSVIIGGEMEGYGVYVEAAHQGVPCIIIKGICDWGMLKNSLSDKAGEDGDKENNERKDALQAMAATRAYSIVFTLLEDPYFFSDYERIEYKLVQVGRFSLKKQHFYLALQVYSFILSIVLVATLVENIAQITLMNLLLTLGVAFGLVFVCALVFAMVEHFRAKEEGFRRKQEVEEKG